jgi:hypothetical protein
MPHFFVAGKDNAQRAMQDLGMFHQRGCGLYDNGHAGLIVGTEERRSVGSNNRMADRVFQGRIIADTNNLLGISAERQISARVVANHLRTHILAGRLGRGV